MYLLNEKTELKFPSANNLTISTIIIIITKEYKGIIKIYNLYKKIDLFCSSHILDIDYHSNKRKLKHSQQ